MIQALSLDGFLIHSDVNNQSSLPEGENSTKRRRATVSPRGAVTTIVLKSCRLA